MNDQPPLLSDDVSDSDRSAIVAGLVAFNGDHGFPWPGRDLNLVLRNGENTVVGGLIGETNASWLFIKGLWVAESLRGRGHGRRLLAAAEDRARGLDCIGVYLDTYDFQARPFYEHLGYRVFGELRDLPPGGAKYYLAKRLVE